MKTSPAGLGLIEASEGLRLQVYKDVAGLPTIGYGHLLRQGESFPNGITTLQAQLMLEADVTEAEQELARLVKVPLTQGQFDALVDFVFNLGAGRLSGSTLLKYLNGGHYVDACFQLGNWDHGLEAGKEVELAALKARRQAEQALWRS